MQEQPPAGVESGQENGRASPYAHTERHGMKWRMDDLND